MTVIEEVRLWKEQNAAESNFDVNLIFASAKTRESISSEKLLDPPVPFNHAY